MAEALRRILTGGRRFWKGWVSLAKISNRKGRLPLTVLPVGKSDASTFRMVSECGENLCSFYHSSRVWQTNGQTDGRTEGFTVANTALHTIVKGGNWRYLRLPFPSVVLAFNEPTEFQQHLAMQGWVSDFSILYSSSFTT